MRVCIYFISLKRCSYRSDNKLVIELIVAYFSFIRTFTGHKSCKPTIVEGYFQWAKVRVWHAFTICSIIKSKKFSPVVTNLVFVRSNLFHQFFQYKFCLWHIFLKRYLCEFFEIGCLFFFCPDMKSFNQFFVSILCVFLTDTILL